jgi:hypothetical protein
VADITSLKSHQILSGNLGGVNGKMVASLALTSRLLLPIFKNMDSNRD